MSSDRSTQTSVADNRLEFESFLANLAARFVNLKPELLDDAIEESLRGICEVLGLDIGVLWQWCDHSPNVLALTHNYRRLEGPPVPPDIDARESFPWTLDEALDGRTVRLAHIEDAPPEAKVDLETWRHFELGSVLVIPLAAGDAPIAGIVSFHTVHEGREWPDEIMQRLQLVAQVFTNALVRKQSEVALQQSEARLQLAAESADVGMWELDVERGLFWASGRARELFGYGQSEEITVESVLESVDPEDRERVGTAISSTIGPSRPIDVEYRIVLPDGQRRWIRSRGRVHPESTGRWARILGASLDVTELKRSEDQLRESYAEVERLRRQLELENAYLKQEVQLRHGRGRIVGESPAITRVLGLVEQVAPAATTVLIEGETGTGKELIARRVHELSPRSGRPMIKVNCAALPSTLVESELFGREKGAYTGAVSREAGRFEAADGSTIFLDEVAELPLELQSKLLRVLEEGQFERVGSPRTLTTDVRVIAATNRDLSAEVEAGRFRSDLFFRLAVFPIEIPPLRDRRGDIPLLVWSVVEEFSAAMHKSIESIRRQDLERLQRYDWPGNVRELRNLVERSMILSSGPQLRVEPPEARAGSDPCFVSLDESQRRQIAKAVEAAGGRISGVGGAAELLGVKPTTLRSRMKRLGMGSRGGRNGLSAD